MAKNYIIFALLLSLAFFLISTNNNIHTRGLQTIGLITTSYLEDGIKGIISYFTLVSKNEELLKENAQLIDLTSKIRRAIAENDQLRAMLKLRDESSSPLIPANVVGRTSEGGKYFITLDAGEGNGVGIGDPVVTGGGLVGIVTAASGNFCLVRTLLDNESRIAARLMHASADGIIVTGENDNLNMRNVSRRYDVSKGEIVETSSLSSLVPPGIVIGVVAEATDETGNVFKQIEVQPAVDFSSLSVAFVMQYSPSEEARDLGNKTLKANQKNPAGK
ncbi:MAG: rod shape-determining protein MreC [Candidatus Kryptoniota bacterium]